MIRGIKISPHHIFGPSRIGGHPQLYQRGEGLKLYQKGEGVVGGGNGAYHQWQFCVGLKVDHPYIQFILLCTNRDHECHSQNALFV